MTVEDGGMSPMYPHTGGAVKVEPNGMVAESDAMVNSLRHGDGKVAACPGNDVVGVLV